MHSNSRVGVLMGGLAPERPVSLKSGEAVLSALRGRGYDAHAVEVGRDLPARLIDAGIEVAWNALHGRYGEDGCVQGLLEVMGIPYTGSGVRASAVAMDKIATKRALRGVASIVMATDAVVSVGDELPDHLSLPVIVKPVVGGSTIGMTIVRQLDEWAGALKTAGEQHDQILVESFVEGDEITVAVLDGRALPVVRIQPRSGFFDFEAKYTDGQTIYEVPATIDEAVARRAQAASIATHDWLGCRGLTRTDFIVPASGQPVLLEINTLPGMTATSLSPMAASVVGMSFADLVEHLLQSATLDP